MLLRRNGKFFLAGQANPANSSKSKGQDPYRGLVDFGQGRQLFNFDPHRTMIAAGDLRKDEGLRQPRT